MLEAVSVRRAGVQAVAHMAGTRPSVREGLLTTVLYRVGEEITS